MFLQRLGRRVRQLVALLASMLRLLIPRRHACLHIRMNIFIVGCEVLNHIVFHRPGKEVELADSSGNAMKVHTGPTAEGVKHLLAVRLEMRLVGEVDNHMLSGLGDVGYIVELGIVGDKPVQDTEGDIGLVIKDLAEEF